MPRGGHCSESLHTLPLQGGKPRALGCQARSLVNRPLSKSPPKLRVVDLCDVRAQQRMVSRGPASWGDSDLTRAPLHLRAFLLPVRLYLGFGVTPSTISLGFLYSNMRTERCSDAGCTGASLAQRQLRSALTGRRLDRTLGLCRPAMEKKAAQVLMFV